MANAIFTEVFGASLALIHEQLKKSRVYNLSEDARSYTYIIAMVAFNCGLSYFSPFMHPVFQTAIGSGLGMG